MTEMPATLIDLISRAAAPSVLRFRRSRPQLRFYDSASAEMWARLENERVTIIPVGDMELTDLYLRHIAHAYRGPLPWLLLHINAGEQFNVAPGELLVSLTAASGFPLCCASTSLSVADAIVAVACELRAIAVLLTWIRSRWSLVACWVRWLAGLRTEIAFDVQMQLRGMRARAETQGLQVIIWSGPFDISEAP